MANDSPEKKRIDAVKATIKDYLNKKKVPALVEVKAANNINEGVMNLVQNYGLGPLSPNTIVLGETEKEENFIKFCGLIDNILKLHKNLVILRQGSNPGETTMIRRQRVIDVWWGRDCLLYTSPSPRDKRQSRMPSSA